MLVQRRHPAILQHMNRCLFLSLAALSVLTASADEAPLILFDGKSLDAWQVVDIGGSGLVDVQDGEMIIDQGESLSGVVYKKSDELPVLDYEITLEAMRLSGVDFFVGLTFPIRDHNTHLTLVLGGWGGSVTGISSIDGLDASENNTGTLQRFEDETWYKLRLQVRDHEIKLFIDDKEIINTDIKDKKLGLREGPMESYKGLSLTTYQTASSIRDVRVTKLPKEPAKP
jgi:hypothetical protein